MYEIKFSYFQWEFNASEGMPVNAGKSYFYTQWISKQKFGVEGTEKRGIRILVFEKYVPPSHILYGHSLT